MAGPEVISVYRSILKAAHRTFRGDLATLASIGWYVAYISDIFEGAKNYARSEFRSPLPAERTVQDRIAEAKEVAQFLRKNFVQAARTSDNYYSTIMAYICMIIT